MQNPTDTRALAHLARLHLSEEQIIRFSEELDHALAYVSRLQGVSESTVMATDEKQPLAEDILRNVDDSLAVSKNSLLENVPCHKNGLIRVRAVL